MISLDTNVLVRFLTQDDMSQYLTVAQLLTHLEKDNRQAFVSLLVVIEINWVLGFSYRLERVQIIEALLALMELPMLNFEHSQKLKACLQNARQDTFDLSDLLIALKSSEHDALPVMTFDKKASKAQGFTLLTQAFDQVI